MWRFAIQEKTQVYRLFPVQLFPQMTVDFGSQATITVMLRHTWPVKSDISGNVSGFVYHNYLKILEWSLKFEMRLQNSKKYLISQCLNLLIILNALGWEFKPGRPFSKETRRRAVDLYLIYSGIKRSDTDFPFSQGRRRNPSKLSDKWNLLACLERKYAKAVERCRHSIKQTLHPQLFLLISTNIELIPSFAFIASPLKATAWEASLLSIGRLINHAWRSIAVNA